MTDKFHVKGFDIEDGSLVGVRDHDGQQTEGTMRPTVEGQPLQDGEEIVRVESVEDGTIHVQSVYAHNPSKGPSKASNPKYRSGYDAVFKRSSAEVN